MDEAQNQLLVRSFGRAKADLKEAVWRAYRFLYLLGKDNKLRQIDLGQITSSTANSLLELYLNELGRTDEITPGVGANKLLKYWPPALTEWSTKGVRDAFYSSPQLPRLLNADAIKRTIADGLSQGTLEYATRDDKGQSKLLHFNDSLAEADVEITPRHLFAEGCGCAKAFGATAVGAPHDRPEHATIQQGEQASFSCAGIDLYSQPIGVLASVWSATGGTVSDGMYSSAKDGSTGLFTVRAELNDLEAIAEIRVISTSDDSKVDDEPQSRVIKWQGDVPPRKWMKFYTKVLSRFASTPGLKLKLRSRCRARASKG